MTPLIKQVVADLCVRPIGFDPAKYAWFDIDERLDGHVHDQRVPRNAFLLPFPEVALVFRVTSGVTGRTNRGVVLLSQHSDLRHGFRLILSDALVEVFGSCELDIVNKGILHTFESERVTATFKETASMFLLSALRVLFESCNEPTQAYAAALRRNHSARPPTNQGYDWHTIVLKPKALKHETQGGSHTTPRRHECRGHWREYESGKRSWVKNHWRGDASKGTVFKDYVAPTLDKHRVST